MNRIRAVLWDFGGVLTTSPFESFARLERARGLPEDFIRSLNATNHRDNAWAKLERSEVSVDEFCVLYQAEAEQRGHSLDAREVLASLSGDLRPEMVDAVRRIRARGLKTGLLTNNVVGLDRSSDRHGILDLFDVIVESSAAGIRKPEREFYLLACRRLGIDPPEAVFLDDLGVNLKPARELGMTPIKVTDPAAALAELEEALGFALTR